MKTRLLLLSMIWAFAYAANAAPPAVTNIQAGQRTGTKLVDITYTLALDTGQKAFVELWFSPDNGLTYPVRCMTVSGDADANVSAGSKTVVWNAENDWGHQFTSNGRIRVIATYGDHPSGFAGSGSNNGGGPGQGDSSLLDIPWNPYFEQGGDPANPSWVNRAIPQTDHGPDGIPGTPDDGPTWSLAQEITGTTLSKILADPIEVTNEKWNAVASWGRDHGYTNLQDAPTNDDEPRTNITFWDALRWCNARSEKEGLTPAYYMDANEAINDTNQNGSYETGEYHDLDGNGQYSPGLTTVFRAGANIPNYGTSISTGPPLDLWITFSPIKKDANGYRLPIVPIFTKLATGGNNQQNWPWGADNPPGLGAPEYGDFAQHVRATAGGNSVSSPSPATARQPNGYGIKDVIGNVGEWTEDAWEDASNPGNPVLSASVYGGSYLGLGQVNVPSTFSNPNAGGQPGWTISKLWDLVLDGNPTTTSPAIGLRCVRYEP
jgi:hypothetical protein